MKKLRLNLDQLSVQGFRTGPEPESRGTVVGHLPETHPNVCPETNNWYCTGGSTCTMYPKYCY